MIAGTGFSHVRLHSHALPLEPNSKPTSISPSNPPSNAVSLLHKCSTMEELHQIHSNMITTGAIRDPLSFTKLLTFCALAPSGSLDYALLVFAQSNCRNPVIWNTMIRGLSCGSNPEEAVFLYKKMVQESFLPNPYTYTFVLKACAKIIALSEGAQIHGCIIKLGFDSDCYVQNALIHLYSVFRSLVCARQMFDKMPEKNIVSWNCMIGGYAELGCWKDVQSLFWLMIKEFSFKPNSITLVRMLTACTRLGDFDSGKLVHRYIKDNRIGSSLNLGNSLSNMYAKFGDMDTASQLFDEMPERDVFSWTTLVSGYAGIGNLDAARDVFDRMPERSTITWNAMISGYVLNGSFEEAILLFREMLVCEVKPDKATILSVFSGSTRLQDLFLGRTIHGFIHKVGINMTLDLANSLLSVYSKSGSMKSAEWLFGRMDVKNEISWTLMMVGYVKSGAKILARQMFDKMPHRDVVSWNALIAALAQCNYLNEALDLFREMQFTKVSPNGVTLVSTLSACAKVGALEQGKWIHSYIDRSNIEVDTHLGASLIDMYAKCGCIELSLEVFNSLSAKDVLTWSTIIGGLAMHGHAELALTLFKQMQYAGIQPDGITFLGVLSACAHAGLVVEGRNCFDLMTQTYGINPETEHYSCMVDLLGRYGLLNEAKEFIMNIPVTSNGEAIWGALLGACRIHGNVELAEYAANSLLEIDPGSSGAYVLLSNVYAKASRWDDVGNVRNIMKGKGVQKVPGCSSIEVNGIVHEFFARDNLHPKYIEIYKVLDEITKQLESAGYVADTSTYSNECKWLEKRSKYLS